MKTIDHGVAVAAALTSLLAACGGGAGEPSPTNSATVAKAAGLVSPTTYYVDAVSGMDSQGGTSAATAWKTLAKVNQLTLHAGDRVLLAQGPNEIWRGSIVLTGTGSTGPSGVVLGSYDAGHGDGRPRLVGVLSGSGLTWTPAGSGWAANVYVASVGQDIPTAVYLGGSRLVPAREPNLATNGYPVYAKLQSAGALTGNCAPLVLATPWSGYAMDGTNIVVRTAPWQLSGSSQPLATNADGTSQACLTVTAQAPAAGQGYYLEAGPQTAAAVAQRMLDAPGEWWVDGGSPHHLYVWTPTGASPGTGLEYAAKAANHDYDSGIVLNNLPGVSVSGIDLDQQVDTGAHLLNSPGASISDVHTSRAGIYGVVLDSDDGATLSNSSISLAGNDGVRVLASNDVHVSGNTIANSGMIGSSLTVQGGGAGILVSGVSVPSGLVIENNSVSDSAYVGITLPPVSGGSVSGNVVQRACKLLADCGGIYLHGATGDSTGPGYGSGSVMNNVVTSLVANRDDDLSAAAVPAHAVAGIYLDEHAGAFKIETNWVSNIGAPGDFGSGIYLHKSSDNLVHGNTVWNATRASLRFQADEITGTQADVHANVVQANQLYAGSTLAGSAPAAPLASTVYAQEWVRPANPSLAFTTDANVVGGTGNANVTRTLGDLHGATWLLRLQGSGSSQDSVLDIHDWQAQAAATDTLAVVRGTPLKMVKPSNPGPELVPDAALAGGWTQYPATDPAIGFAPCAGQACAHWTVVSSSSVMLDAGLVMPAPGKLVYFELHAKAASASARMNVSFRRVSDSIDLLPVVYQTAVPSYEDSWLQGVYAVNAYTGAGGPSRLSFSTATPVSQEIDVTGVSLRAIDGYETMQPGKEGVLLANAGGAATTVACAASGLRSCANLVDENGSSVTLNADGTITVPANSRRMVFVADTYWAR